MTTGFDKGLYKTIQPSDKAFVRFPARDCGSILLVVPCVKAVKESYTPETALTHKDFVLSFTLTSVLNCLIYR